MTAREYLENKYPQMRGHLWNTNPDIDDDWVAEMMTEYAEQQVKLLATPAVMPTLPLDEETKTPIQDALYATNKFTTDDCESLSDGILQYIRDAGMQIVRQ